MTEDEEIEQRNIGAVICANLLREIAETGKHRGVFGAPEIEAAAQAILKLHERIQRAERSQP